MKVQPSPYQIKLIKCNCGDKNCDYHGFSDGRFPQGSGWDRETAERHLLAVNTHNIMLEILTHLHPKIADDKVRAAVGSVIMIARGEA